jgi:hypothetical protein
MCAREIEQDIELGLSQVPRTEDQPIVGDTEPSGVRQDVAGVSVDAQAEITDKELGSVLMMPVFAPPYAPVWGKPAADGSLDDGGCRLRDHGPMVTAWEAADEQALAVLRATLPPSSRVPRGGSPHGRLHGAAGDGPPTGTAVAGDPVHEG